MQLMAMTASVPRAATVARAQSLGQLVLDSASRFGGIAIQSLRSSPRGDIAYPALGTISTEIAAGLIALGIEPGDRVAILGLTSA